MSIRAVLAFGVLLATAGFLAWRRRYGAVVAVAGCASAAGEPIAPTIRSCLTRGDAFAVLALLLGGVVFAFTRYSFAELPYEDAAMVMRYAEHLAAGHGLVWNPGEPPVDGATDFLFTVTLGVLVKAGLDPQLGVVAIGLLSHFLTVALVYLAARRLWQAHWLVAGVAAGLIAFGPGSAYVATGFGTPFFGLFAALSWCLAIDFTRRAAAGENVRRRGFAFASSALVMGLIRPEGVLLSGFLVAAVVIKLGIRAARPLWRRYLLVFAILGGAYFVWRWTYFGHPLPNPFYKKGGGKLYPASLRAACAQVFAWTMPWGAVFLAGLRRRAIVRDTLFLALPVAGFTAIWVLLSPEMNWLGRFQYAALVVFVVSWPGAVRGLWGDWQPSRLRQSPWPQVALAGACLAFAVRTARIAVPEPVDQGSNGLHAVASVLRPYADRGYAIATTEAGLLPFVSRWNAVDTWGLNDPWIAHHGVVTDEYLDRHRPQVIMADAFCSPGTGAFVGAGDEYPRYDEMIATMVGYAKRHDYVLAAAFAMSPERVHYYFVRPDFPESSELVAQIRTIAYVWPGSDQVVANTVVGDVSQSAAPAATEDSAAGRARRGD